jgi:translation initiation factor IF-2
LATRVFELARELGVTSKLILDKCRAEGLELKNHMATLTMGLEMTIREWFSETAAHTSVETSEHVDLEKARQEARKQRRKGTKKEAEDAAIAAAMPAPEAPAEPPAVAETPAAAAEAVPEVPATTSLPAAEAAVVEEAPAEAAPAPEIATPPAASTPTPAAAAEAPSPVPAAKEPPPPPAAPAKQPVKPAGPQVVPAPARLRGPRVVRMERPDYVRRPVPRQPAATAGTAASTTGGTTLPKRGLKKPLTTEEEEEEDKKKGKRSPRRRGATTVGRSADSGEVLKEWRDKDLLERSERLAAATGGTLRRHRATVAQQISQSGPTLRTGKVEVEEPVTVKALSAATGLKATDLIRKLMNLGVLATVNQVLDRETAEALVLDYGVELEVKRPKTAEETLVQQLESKPKSELVGRPPVVTFLGHVDHGKTSLLDKIRNQTVAAGEAGGITQHIGAYRYDVGNSHVVFLDTPGHEAFTAMRSRGANMTDVVVLVVAADDGVMPQTVEAISHAKAAKVPIIVALNKIDLPNANENKVLGQLAEQGLQPREWGGNVEVLRTSAATGQGIPELVETLSLEAELLELKAEKDADASGYVIEAKMDQGLGAVASLLVLNGTLRVGDILLAGKGYGRVRQILDTHRKPLSEAGPATPVEVAGLDELPEAGDHFYVVQTLEQARAVSEDRQHRDRTDSMTTKKQISLESLLGQIEAGKATELALVIKADVQGSIEAIVNSLNKLSTPEVRVNVLHAAVGGISTGDVALAEASNAIIIGFNAVPDSSARQMAEARGVDIRLYRIIYDIIEDIRKALEEGLAPEVREEVLGHAEVRQTFKVSRIGTVAGCQVSDGVAQRNAKVRITRNNIVIGDNRVLTSLKRFKDDAREVRAGMECGLKIADYDDIKEGDVLEFYRQIEVARKL